MQYRRNLFYLSLRLGYFHEVRVYKCEQKKQKYGVPGLGKVSFLEIMVSRSMCSREMAGIRLVLLSIFLFFAIGNVSWSETATSNSFKIGPRPSWVISIEDSASAASPGTKEEDNDGEQYFLLDHQTHAGTQEYYSHVVKRIANQNGVQNGAQLQFEFNPSYEQLTIHSIVIRREGKTLNRLEMEKFKVLQQETSLERNLFNGNLSAVLFLEDVRVGDVIEYASTTRGANPILKGRFVGGFSVEWSAFLKKLSYRLLWPSGRTLTFKNHKTEVQPVIRDLPGLKEYVWDMNNLPPLTADDRVPAWYEKYGWVQLTEFSTWKEVVDWAAPLYETEKQELPEDLQKKIALWRLLKTPEKQVSAALRFVQDEVRYLGIEVGPGSHQPNQPNVVFARRFGDCKDKAFLLCTVLRELGLEAHPVLVSTYTRKRISEWAPSPFAFNHVVAQVKIGKQVHWLDATRTHQRGPLANIYLPDYGRGLVIARGGSELTTFSTSKSVEALTTITATFTIRDYTNSTGYKITTVNRGHAADLIREELAETRREVVEKNYLNYQAKLYPKIKQTRPLEVVDDQERNIITINEHYAVPDAWELSDNKDHWSMMFYPDELYDMAQKPETSFRTMPLAIVHPKHHKQTIQVTLPEDYEIGNENTKIESKGVRFKREVVYDKISHCITINYDFESKADSVSVEDAPDHLQKLKQIRENLSYGIQHPNRTTTANGFRFNWPMIGMGFLYGIIAIAGAGLVYWFRPKPNLTEPPLLGNPLEGIGGWLVLVAIGLFLRPILVLVTIGKSYSAYFSAETWSLVTTPGSASYHPMYGAMLVFELFSNITMFIFSILLIILFFQKRFAFPRFFIAYMIIFLGIMVLDHIGTGVVDKIQKNDAAAMREITRGFMTGLIWSLYMLTSKRVKATFVR